MNFTLMDFIIMLGFQDAENEQLGQENEELMQQLDTYENQDDGFFVDDN